MFQPFPLPHPLDQPLFDLELDLSRGVIRPCGDLDRDTAPLALAAIQAMRAKRPGHLTVDLADVTAICAEGLDAIVAIAIAQHGTKHDLHLINASAQVKRTLLAGGMANLLDRGSTASAGAGPR